MATHPVTDTATTAALTDVQHAIAGLIAPADTDASERELVDAIRALEDTKATLCAAQADLTLRLDQTVRARHEQARIPAARRGRDVAGLVAYARRESPAKGSRLLGLAHALTELPHTRSAMHAGILSEWRATLIARETACLSTQDRATVDTQLCAPTPATTPAPSPATTPDGIYPFDGWGDKRLTAEAQKAVYALDPAAVVNRRAKAEADRRVTMRPAPDTMARLSALLPAAQGVAVWATLTRAADQARAGGDPRTHSQVMTDTLVERITGQQQAEAVPVTVNLIISDQALLTGSQQPAWMQGYGPIPPEALDPQTFTALRRLYATPTTGALVAMESTARIFPAGLAKLIDLRDHTCRTPWCGAPIRHHDHAEDHAAGGPTTATNGQGLCEQCNHTKQAPGWTARPINGPPGQLHQIDTELPTGHVVRSTAPAMPTPATVQPISHGEIHLSRIVLDYAA